MGHIKLSQNEKEKSFVEQEKVSVVLINSKEAKHEFIF